MLDLIPGTGSSNPPPSSEESANHRFLSDEAHHCGGSNAAARSKYFPWRSHTDDDRPGGFLNNPHSQDLFAKATGPDWPEPEHLLINRARISQPTLLVLPRSATIFGSMCGSAVPSVRQRSP